MGSSSGGKIGSKSGQSPASGEQALNKIFSILENAFIMCYKVDVLGKTFYIETSKKSLQKRKSVIFFLRLNMSSKTFYHLDNFVEQKVKFPW